MDAEQRRLMGGIGSSWLAEDTISVFDDKGNEYAIGAASLNTAFVNAGIPHNERAKYKKLATGVHPKPLPASVLTQVKKLGRKIEKPWSAADAEKSRKRQDKEFARGDASTQKAKDKLIDTIEKWAEDAGADFDGDESDAHDSAADMALSFMHEPGAAKLVQQSGLSKDAVRSIAADYFYDAAVKAMKSAKDEGIGGVPRGHHAIGSLSAFAKTEVAPWLPPFVLDQGDQQKNQTEKLDAKKAKKFALKFASLK